MIQITKIRQFSLFPNGSSLIDVTDSTQFLHVSHNSKGELILHAIEQFSVRGEDPVPELPVDRKKIHRKIISVPSHDEFTIKALNTRNKFLGASTDHTKTTYLVFLDMNRYDAAGERVPFLTGSPATDDEYLYDIKDGVSM